jgi:hypothetical protein
MMSLKGYEVDMSGPPGGMNASNWTAEFMAEVSVAAYIKYHIFCPPKWDLL